MIRWRPGQEAAYVELHAAPCQERLLSAAEDEQWSPTTEAFSLG